MTCLNCRYWQIRRVEACFGECRRHAPTIDFEGESGWPRTKGEGWCGEWEPKLDHPDTERPRVTGDSDTV